MDFLIICLAAVRYIHFMIDVYEKRTHAIWVVAQQGGTYEV